MSIDDLSDAEIASVMELGQRIAAGFVPRPRQSPFSVGLLFLAPSLRTRVGFAAATVRLGGTPIGLQDLRFGQDESLSESLNDSIRVLSGMVDLVVLRTPHRLDHAQIRNLAQCPLINGGDGVADHPVQSLIDLFAITRQAGPVGNQRIGLCGDLQTRSARSLLRLLKRFPPAHLRLMAPPGRRAHGLDLAPIGHIIEEADEPNFCDLDVLYLPGLPKGTVEEQLDAEVRERYTVTEANLAQSPREMVILSPLPLIDEVSETLRHDARFGAFRQSDEGVSVRMAILTWLLGT